MVRSLCLVALHVLTCIAHTAIRILHKNGIVHRDISFRNILLYNHSGVPRGLLIDYDYAVSIERAETTAIAERTVRISNIFYTFD